MAAAPTYGRASAPAFGILLPVKGGGRKRPALRQMISNCEFAETRSSFHQVLRGSSRTPTPTKQPRRVRAKHERIKSVFAVGLPRQKLPEASSEWACSTPQPRSGATALYPRPHSSSPNQSLCFDLVRSGSGMGLLHAAAALRRDGSVSAPPFFLSKSKPLL